MKGGGTLQLEGLVYVTFICCDAAFLDTQKQVIGAIHDYLHLDDRCRNGATRLVVWEEVGVEHNVVVSVHAEATPQKTRMQSRQR